MARPLDPYRILELPRDATLDEVKTAYRRLAKLYHPDSAGERALPRFLAVQAAYEALTEGPAKLRSALGGRQARSSRASADPWASRPTGTGPRATGGTSGSAGPSASRSGTRPGARGDVTGPARTGTGTGPRGGASAGDGAASGAQAGSSRTRGPAGPRPRRTRRTPGSTSYDGAETEPFEPEWQGASWYGGSSGTYWTINPREFADPRKHGPEYLARAADSGLGPSRQRRRPPGLRTEGSSDRPADVGAGPGSASPAVDDVWTAAPAHGPAGGPPDPIHGATPPRPMERSRGSDAPAITLIVAALLAVAFVAVLFAIMAEPTASGTISFVPVVAFIGIAIVALVRVLSRDARPRA